MSASATLPVEPAGSSFRVMPQSLESIRQSARAEAARQQPAGSRVALQAYAARLLAGELARCERAMTPDEWREHRSWVEANARASLRAVLDARAERGPL